MKIKLAALLFVVSFYQAWAQPANNTIATATTLSHIPYACSSLRAYTTVAATADGTSGSCWNTTGGSNVWFKFTASTTELHVDISANGSGSGAGTGTLQYAHAALWNSTASTQLACNTYSSQYSGVSLDYASLTIGQDYYISVDNHNGNTGYRGTFTLCMGDEAGYDLFEGAQALTMNTTSADAAYSTRLATSDKSGATCWNTGGGSNRWFSFTAPASGTIKANFYTGGSEGNLQYPYMALWQSNGTTQVACVNYTSQYSDLEISAIGLTGGATYYISIDNHNGSTGYRGSFKIGIADAVTYDYYEGAVALTMDATSADAAYTTEQATNDRNPGSCWNTTGGSNRWFSFVAPAFGGVTLNLYTGGSEGTVQYPYMAIWQSDGTTQISCVNYTSQYSDLEISAVGLTPGNTYYVTVDNHNGSTGYRGSFKIGIASTITYDYYEGAQSLSMNSTSADAAYTTNQATNDRSPGNCWNTTGGSNRWFSFTAPATGTVTLDLFTGGSEGTIQYPYMAIWQSDGTTQVACVNYTSQYSDLQISTVGLTPSATYYITVDNHNGSTGYRGSFKLAINDGVTYDYYEGAVSLTMNSSSANGAYTTSQATNDKSPASCWNTSGGSNRWFAFVAPATGTVTLNLYTGGSEGTVQYPYLAIWQSNGTTQVACVNYTSQYSDLEISAVGLTIGNTYYVSVDNHNGSTGYRGTFKLAISDAVSYDYYEGAVTLTMNTTSADAAYTTSQATSDKNPGSCWNTTGGSNRWFKFVAPATNNVTLSVYTGGSEGTIQYPYVAIWQSDGTTQVACVNYTSQYSDLEISAIGLTPGNTYYISIDNHNGSTGYRGSFKIGISDAVSNDFYEGATDATPFINTCSDLGIYTTAQATSDRSPGSCWNTTGGSNRWFKFTATANGVMHIEVRTGGSEGTLQYPYIAVWDASLTQLACQQYVTQYSDLEANVTGLTPGATYYFSVDNHNGSSGYRGTFTLCLNDVGDYDFWEGAKTLGDLDNWCSTDAEYTTISGTTNGGTVADSKKGSCWNTNAYSNKWFKFTAIYSTATIQIKTGGSEGTVQYPYVALWDNSSSSPTQLACAKYTTQYSDLSVTYSSLTIGNVYYISVDNHSGSSSYRGTFKLCVTNVDPTGYYSIADGDWSNPATWSNASHAGPASSTSPGVGHVVNIKGNNVTVSGSQVCATLNLIVDSNPTSITVDGATASLAVSGNANITNSGNNFDGNLTVTNGASLSVGNDAIFTRSGGANPFNLTVTDASVSVTRDMKWINSGSSTVEDSKMTLTGTASVNVARDFTMQYSGGMRISHELNGDATLTVARDIGFTSTAASSIYLTLNNSSSISIQRNFTRGSGASIFGNIVSNDASSIIFSGSSNVQNFPQTTGSGGDSFYFGDVTINNTNPNIGGDQVTVSNPATVNGTLTLTNGLVKTTSTKYITIGQNGSISAGHVNGFIDGPLKRVVSTLGSATVTFPIGKITSTQNDFKPVTLDVNHLDATSITYTAEMKNTSAEALGYSKPASIDKVSGTRYWTVTRTTNAPDNFSSATITLPYSTSPVDDEVTDYQHLTVVKNIGSGTTWVDVGGTATANGTGTITSGSFSSFSNIAFANLSSGTNPLPVVLVSFEAAQISGGIQLDWRTASELNSDYFAVQRSASGDAWQEIGRRKALGNSATGHTYDLVDRAPLNGRVYYRLRQVDLDGNEEYSEVVVVDGRFDSEEKNIQIYPNPATDRLFVVVEPGETGLQVLSLTGSSKPYAVTTVENSPGLIEVDISELASGVYILKVGGGLMIRFVKL